jgi:hypothetical protein
MVRLSPAPGKSATADVLAPRGVDSCSQAPAACCVPELVQNIEPGLLPSALVLIRPVYLLMVRLFGWLVLLGRSCDDAMIGSVWPSCTHRTTSSNRCRTYGRCSSGPDAWWWVGPAAAADRRHVRLVRRTRPGTMVLRHLRRRRSILIGLASTDLRAQAIPGRPAIVSALVRRIHPPHQMAVLVHTPLP